MSNVRRLSQFNVSFQMFSLLFFACILQRESEYVCVCVCECVCRNRGEEVHFWLLEMPAKLLVYLWPANPDGQGEVKVPVLSGLDSMHWASLGLTYRSGSLVALGVRVCPGTFSKGPLSPHYHPVAESQMVQ